MVHCLKIQLEIMDFLPRAKYMLAKSKFKAHHYHLEKVVMGSWESTETRDLQRRNLSEIVAKI